jgi:DNA-binding beta-propeller fold protein YncE
MMNKIAAGAVAFAVLMLVARSGAAAEEGPPAGVTFTDCAVWITGPDGRTVRHLAAGAIGVPGSAAPLVDNSLHQKLLWDGTDDHGKIVDVVGCRVHVGLGTAARFDRIIGRDPQWLGNIHALAAGGGRLYAFCDRGIVVLDRDGKYLRQIVPAPADLPLEKLAGLRPVKLEDGGVCFTREYEIPGKMKYIGSMALTPQGQLLLPSRAPYARKLARIGVDGSVAADAFDTRLTMLSDVGYLYLASDPAGRALYVSGAEAGYRGDDARKACYRQAVYRLNLSGKGPAEIFVGDDENRGGPGAAVNYPKGLAVDATGLLYVCNYAGNNIAVYTPKASLVRSFRVERPHQVAVHPRTGRVYVLAGEEVGYEKSGYDFEATMREAHLLRFDTGGTLERKMTLADPYVRKSSTRPGPSYQLRFAADFSEEVPVLWVGLADPAPRESDWCLLRIEDGPEEFSEPRDVCPTPEGALVDPPLQLALDRAADVLYTHDSCSRLLTSRLLRLSGDGRYLSPLTLGGTGKDAMNFSEIAFGPDGDIYTLAWKGLWGGHKKTTLMRFDPTGAPVPFAKGSDGERLLVRAIKGARGSTSRGLAVGPDGSVYVLYFDRARPKEGRRGWEIGWNLCTSLARFSSDGELADRNLVAYLRSGAQTVKVDRDGAIYVGENTMPIGTAYPRELAAALGNPFARGCPARTEDGGFAPLLRWMGSVIKFGSEGGTITGLPDEDGTPPASRPPADTWRPAPEVQWFPQQNHRVRMTGALWQFHGFAPVPAQYQGVTHVERCVCHAGRFDLDEFGRVFVPDVLRHRVTVLDKEGNVVTRFGTYGNADSAGPEIGLSDPWWIAAAADRVYIGENQSCRIVKVRLEPAVKESCAVK